MPGCQGEWLSWVDGAEDGEFEINPHSPGNCGGRHKKGGGHVQLEACHCSDQIHFQRVEGGIRYFYRGRSEGGDPERIRGWRRARPAHLPFSDEEPDQEDPVWVAEKKGGDDDMDGKDKDKKEREGAGQPPPQGGHGRPEVY